MIPAWIGEELQPVEKLEVHRRGLKHKAVSVFVCHGDQTLLQRRALGKYHTPGLWTNSCCTHPFWQEQPEDCARRRLAEELGITGLSLTHRNRIEYRADVGQGMIEHELVDIYTAEAPVELHWVLDPAEVMEARWITLPALEREIRAEPYRFTPWLRIYLAEHQAKIFR
ncbi:isopentenyl-diphosphate Delta-isomerase [Thioclava sp. BHET1]|nr:isopentenyl-diphosphate Delta-isomerase [Thioclava sp. BHET1]